VATITGLPDRDGRERHFAPEIAAGDHHAVGGGADLVEVLECRGPFELRDDRERASGFEG